MTLFEEIKQQEAELIQIRRDLHRIPEVGMLEKKTTRYIKDALQDCAVEIHDIGVETGLYVLIRGEYPGRTIALRADIDGLPMKEESGLPFASEHPEACHACGHDLHTAVAIFAVRYLSAHKEKLHGNVWVYFQPAEETLWGAKKIIEAGCLELDPKPESILALHTCTPLQWGKFGFLKGASNAGCNNLRITVRSSGGHGACPQRCGDPVLASAMLLAQLQTCVSRDNDSMLPAVLTFGSIHGGTAPNIIPAEVVMEGTLRTQYPESLDVIKKSILRISEHACAAMRTECDVEFLQPSVPCLHNDSEVVDRAERSARKLFGDEAVCRMELASTGSEDFANYLQYIPGALIRLGTRNPEDPQTMLGQHAAAVRFDERSLCYGAAFLCQYVQDYLCEK